MGGRGGGSKKKSTPPPQAEPINYAALMAESNKAAKEQFRDQVAAQLEAYPKQEALQLGTISNIASNLSGTGGALRRYTVDAQGNITGSETIGTAAPNQYTARATDQLIAAAGQADDLQSVADYTDQLGFTAAEDLQGTEIERELNRQALNELQLGRSLTPEQERMAQQAARAGMAARGLGVGTGALAAEILNRDMFASQREADRRNFAGTTNQMLTSNRQNRLGLVGNILGQSANTRLAQANLRTGLAGANITIDPYARALAPGAGMGSTTLGNSGQMIGNTWQGATQMAGNVASFNANMIDSRWNTYQNNKTAIKAAELMGNATNSAGWMSLLGGGMQAGGALGGAAISKYSDRRMKKDIKPVSQDGAGGVLGLTTYEYRYKDGDGKKHLGFMAQDVQKILPEAVEEVDYKGQRRLTIKPQVIGDAIATILAKGEDALFAKGYTVGSGK